MCCYENIFVNKKEIFQIFKHCDLTDIKLYFFVNATYSKDQNIVMTFMVVSISYGTIIVILHLKSEI